MKPAHFAATAGGVFLLDQATKLLVRRAIPLNSGVTVAPFFSLTHVQNTGAAFGIAQDGNLFFIATTIIILTVLGFLHRRLAAQGRWTALGLPLLWGGALGNLVDRLRVGAVVDFLDFLQDPRDEFVVFRLVNSNPRIFNGRLILKHNLA